MDGPGSASASSSHKLMDLPKTMRPCEASNAISQSEIAAIRSVPAAAALSTVWRACCESSGLPATTQSQTCVSSSSGCTSEVFGIAGPFHIDRIDDIAANPDGPGHTPEEVYRFLLHWHQLGDRFSPLGDDDRPALPCHLVHQAQAIGLKLRCGDLSDLVVHQIQPWSSGPVQIVLEYLPRKSAAVHDISLFWGEVD